MAEGRMADVIHKFGGLCIARACAITQLGLDRQNGFF
jgi:hypothetical protein